MLLDIVRPFIALVCLAGITGWLAYLRAHANWSRYAVGPICLLLHILLFELAIILYQGGIIHLDILFINGWSQVIWMQTAITTTSYAFGLLYEFKCYKSCQTSTMK
jgi:hypothetical protein